VPHTVAYCGMTQYTGVVIDKRKPPPSSWNTFSIPLFRMNAEALSQRTPAVQYISTCRDMIWIGIGVSMMASRRGGP
jgi:hypothetical protein